jgi:hypothetical protein
MAATPTIPLLLARFIALTQTLTQQGLLAQQEGDGRAVAVLAFDPLGPGAVPTFAPTATAAQKTQAQTLIAGWNWSQAAQDTYVAGEAKRQAKAALTDAQDPTRTASRCGQRVLYASLVETRAKINEIIALVNSRGVAPGGAIAPLTNRTWAQAVVAAQAQIDTETDPGS